MKLVNYFFPSNTSGVLSWVGLGSTKPVIPFDDFTRLVQQNGESERKRFLYDNGRLRVVDKESALLTPDANRKTHQIFIQTIRGTFTSQKVLDVCSQYGNIELLKPLESGDPLEFDLIKVFGVGAASATVDDLRSHNHTWSSIEKLCPAELEKIYEKATQHAYLGNSKDPKTLHGAPTETHEQVAFNNINRTRTRNWLFRGISTLVSKDPNIPRLHPYYSRLEMAIICLLSGTKEDIGLILPAPGDAKGTLDFYKVHNVVAEEGLTAFFIKPVSEKSSLKPMVLFRCTNQAIYQNNAFDSIRNCFDKHIGRKGYQATKKALTKALNDPTFVPKSEKVKCLCYSLGAAQGSYFVEEHYERVEEMVCFNGAGNNGDLVDSFAKKINSLSSTAIPPRIYHYRNVANNEGTDGDWVNDVGQKRIGQGVNHPNMHLSLVERILDDKAIPDKNQHFNPLELAKSFDEYHGDRLELGGRYNIWVGKECDRRLNTQEVDSSLEEARQKFRKEVIPYIYAVYELIEFVLSIFKIRLLKNSRTHRPVGYLSSLPEE